MDSMPMIALADPWRGGADAGGANFPVVVLSTPKARRAPCVPHGGGRTCEIRSFIKKQKKSDRARLTLDKNSRRW